MLNISNDTAISIMRQVAHYLRTHYVLQQSYDLGEGEDGPLGAMRNHRRDAFWIVLDTALYYVVASVGMKELILQVFGNVETQDDTWERKQYVGSFIQSMELPWQISNAGRVTYMILEKRIRLEDPIGTMQVRKDLLQQVKQALSEAHAANTLVHTKIMAFIAPNSEVDRQEREQNEQQRLNHEYISPSLHYASVLSSVAARPGLNRGRGCKKEVATVYGTGNYVPYNRLSKGDKYMVDRAVGQFRASLMSKPRPDTPSSIEAAAAYVKSHINESEDLFACFVVSPYKDGTVVSHVFVTNNMDDIVHDANGKGASFDGLYYSHDKDVTKLPRAVYSFNVDDVLADGDDEDDAAGADTETAAPYAKDKYVWFSVKGGKTIKLRSAKGKEVTLKGGEKFGVRPATSSKGMWRVITESLGKNIVFSYDSAKVNKLKGMGKLVVAAGFQDSPAEEFIGLDFDGTIAHYDGWKGEDHLGSPIHTMVEKVKAALAEGKKFKVFTARANKPKVVKLIQDWLEDNGLPRFEVTNVKEPTMSEFWDDKAKGVKKNTGEFAKRRTIEEKLARLHERRMGEG